MQVFGACSSYGKGERRTIALSFDDGPSPGSLQVAEHLAASGIKATFFVCGGNVLRHPEIARELHDGGHELGNHTMTHRRLCPRVGWKLNILSPETVYGEFAEAQEVIVGTTGFSPRLLRAPYGLSWFGVGAAERRLGLRRVHWSVIAHDWEWLSGRVVRHVMTKAAPGGIICLHDGRDTRVNPDLSVTLSALRELIPRLEDLGYGFETVSEILE